MRIRPAVGEDIWLLERLMLYAGFPPHERRHPELIKGSRRLRIAKGSGTTVQQVNQLVKQFGEMRKLMRGLQQGKMPDLGQLMRNR